MGTPWYQSAWSKLTGWFRVQQQLEQTINSKQPHQYKHVLVTIHGFGKKRSNEMQYIKQWGEEAGWLVVIFDMFDYEVETVPEFEKWMITAKEKVEEIIAQGYTVDLLGFSMGGVMAAHLASELAIRRLILLAPAFDFLSLESASRLLALSATSVLKDSEQKFIKDLKARLLPPEYFPQFVELVRKYKNSIDNVTCPVLLVHGSQDETIPVRSSRLAYQHIKHNNKQLFVIEGGNHQLMLDPSIRWEVFVLIRLFLEEEIVKTENFEYNMQEQIDDEE